MKGDPALLWKGEEDEESSLTLSERISVLESLALFL